MLTIEDRNPALSFFHPIKYQSRFVTAIDMTRCGQNASSWANRTNAQQSGLSLIQTVHCSKERGTLSFILFSIFDTKVGFVGVRTWWRQNRQANSTNTKLSVLSLMSDSEEGGSLDSGVVAHNFRSFLTLGSCSDTIHACMQIMPQRGHADCPLPALLGNNWWGIVERAGTWRRVKVITSNLLPIPALSTTLHQLLPTTAGNGPA